MLSRVIERTYIALRPVFGGPSWLKRYRQARAALRCEKATKGLGVDTIEGQARQECIPLALLRVITGEDKMRQLWSQDSRKRIVILPSNFSAIDVLHRRPNF